LGSKAVTPGEWNAYSQEVQRNAQFTTDAAPYIKKMEQSISSGNFKAGCDAALIAYGYYKKINLSVVAAEFRGDVAGMLSSLRESELTCRAKGYIR
jgi:hypothetical protein